MRKIAVAVAGGMMLLVAPAAAQSARPVYSSSFEQIKSAAERGDAEAQNTLGGLYFNGRGVTRDVDEAIKWYTMSAEQGNVLAQYNLGNKYSRGDGVTQDNIRAHMWWSLSVSERLNDGATERDKIEREMTPADVVRAEQLARECIEKEFKGC